MCTLQGGWFHRPVRSGTCGPPENRRCPRPEGASWPAPQAGPKCSFTQTAQLRRFAPCLICARYVFQRAVTFFNGLLQEGGENLAGPADLHLFLPVLMGLAFADGAVDEPAELAGVKLPGRAAHPSFLWTLFDDPAGFHVLFVGPVAGEQKKDLPLHVSRDLSPPLLITMHRLDGDAKQFSELTLGFFQPVPGLEEFFFFQFVIKRSPFVDEPSLPCKNGELRQY